MPTYEPPIVDDLGTVAELLQALGVGPGSDADFPILARLEDRGHRFLDVIMHS